MSRNSISIDDLAVDGVELTEEQLAGVSGGDPIQNTGTWIHRSSTTWVPDIDTSLPTK